MSDNARMGDQQDYILSRAGRTPRGVVTVEIDSPIWPAARELAEGGLLLPLGTDPRVPAQTFELTKRGWSLVNWRERIAEKPAGTSPAYLPWFPYCVLAGVIIAWAMGWLPG